MLSGEMPNILSKELVQVDPNTRKARGNPSAYRGPCEKGLTPAGAQACGDACPPWEGSVGSRLLVCVQTHMRACMREPFVTQPQEACSGPACQCAPRAPQAPQAAGA